MSSEINWKNIIFYTVFCTIIMVLVEYFIQPTSYIKFDFFKNISKKIIASQHIAPERLFINTWRITKNIYVDETLNKQDFLYWRKRYSRKIKTIEDANVAINSMLASLNDPYSKFMLSNPFSRQKMVIDSKITGIGVLFDKTDDGIVVNHVFANTSASEANIQAGDAIISIDGKDTKFIEMDEIVSALSSGKTDKVKVTVKRNNVLETKELTKKDLFVQTMDYKITDDNIGIIKLSNLMGQMAVWNFKRLLLATNDTRGLIIDLRNNYGGVLANAIQMANYMMDKNEIVRIDSRVNREYEIYSANENIFKKKPIVIIVNDKTASAAEIFAGTLQVNLGATLIGKNTFGKNEIQQVIPMHNGTGLIITTDKYILPDGRDIYRVGLQPDIFLKEQSTTSKTDWQLEEAKKLINNIVKNKN